MANYKKMYAILCGAIDDAIDSLEQIPQAHSEVEKLKSALLDAEEMFISSADKEDLYSWPKRCRLKSLHLFLVFSFQSSVFRKSAPHRLTSTGVKIIAT